MALASAARAVPLAAVLLHVLREDARHGNTRHEDTRHGNARHEDHRALLPVLTVAGAAQLGDAAIGVGQGIAGMAVGGSVGAVVHLASAWWLSRHRRAAAAAV
ncbi:hypothetical protein [Streptomyces sp. NBC_00893]|uniref:hypothetical protein n=1 Tax=Streptomyces sp. NBC_00893 TaxID=2975862 RepID=UPI0022517678|nr:hypothetical protein [Streptomyces sp. NBC_00893]MCX4847569.1 hypothetical protein [Streptomyces sp. NBC_00893]